MSDWRSMMDKTYVGHWDLPPGRDVTVTITGVEKVKLDDPVTHKPGKAKPILSFKEVEKKLVGNVTNCRAIATLYSNDTTKWVGKKIALYRTTTSVGGTPTECVRVRPTAPEEKK